MPQPRGVALRQCWPRGRGRKGNDDGSGGGGRLRGGDGGTAGSGEASVPVPAPSCPSADRLRLDGPVTTDFRPLTRLGWHLTPVALSRGRKPWLSQHRGSPSPDCKDRDLKRGHARGRHRSLRAEIARLSDAALTGHDIPGFLEMPDAGRGGRRLLPPSRVRAPLPGRELAEQATEPRGGHHRAVQGRHAARARPTSVSDAPLRTARRGLCPHRPCSSLLRGGSPGGQLRPPPPVSLRRSITPTRPHLRTTPGRAKGVWLSLGFSLKNPGLGLAWASQGAPRGLGRPRGPSEKLCVCASPPVRRRHRLPLTHHTLRASPRGPG